MIARSFARFARSLTELMARIETYRALLNIRDIGAGGLLEREQEKRSVAIPKTNSKYVVLYC